MENAIVRVPVARRRGGVQADQRPGGVHARTASSSSARPRCAGSGRRPASARTGSPAPAGSGSSSPSGSSRACRRSTSGRWTRAASAARTARATTRSRARSRCTRPTTTSKYPGHERAGRTAAARSRRRTRGSRELGAAFGEKSGWERANWFEPNAARGDESLRPRGWAGRLWSPAIGAEHLACRETAALFDETSFAKIEVSGEGAPAFLERLCANTVARDVGAITYTSMLNARGGIECDFTVTRLAEERFRIVTGTAFGQHDLAWIRQHAPDDGVVASRTSPRAYACLGLWGPASREILQPLTTDDRSTFRYMRARELAVGTVPCLALRVTYVGELGWELYCPTEFGLALWDAIWDGGPRARPRRRRLQGDRLAAAREGLPRLGRRHHARRHAVRGRARVRGQARQGRLHRPRGAARAARSPSAASAASSSPTRARSRSARSRCASRATPVGRVTSGGYGYSVERSIAYAYLPAPNARAGPAGRGRDLRRVGRGRGRARAALRSGRGAHPVVIDEVVERVWPGGVESVEVARRRDHEPQLQGVGRRRDVRPADRRQGHRAARDRPPRRARGFAGRGAARDRAGGRRLRRARGLPRDALRRGRGRPGAGRARRPGCCAGSTAGRPIAGRFDAFRVVEAYAAIAQRHGVALPPGFAAAKAIADRIERTPRPTRSARATTTCWPRTSSTTASGSGSSTGSTRAWATRPSTSRTSPSRTASTRPATRRCSRHTAAATSAATS